MIEKTNAVRAFEALAHDSRLAVLRLLVPAGEDGMAAGEIGGALGLAPTRLSFHLGRLSSAGLVEARREGRHLYYAVRYPTLSGLVRFLVSDCCAAAPEGCLPDCPGLPAGPNEFRLPGDARSETAATED